MLKSKSLLYYAILFSSNNFEKHDKMILKCSQQLKRWKIWKNYFVLFVVSIDSLKNLNIKNIKGGRINLDIKKSWFNWKYIII